MLAKSAVAVEFVRFLAANLETARSFKRERERRLDGPVLQTAAVIPIGHDEEARAEADYAAALRPQLVADEIGDPPDIHAGNEPQLCVKAGTAVAVVRVIGQASAIVPDLREGGGAGLCRL